MSFILGTCNEQYEIYFSHQCDNRHFNRGAMKNIGFLAMKSKYPDTYKTFIYVFHDIDTVPFHRLFDYETKPGTVKHFYGFETALGGIVSITGEDMETINGFPNYWGWGLEDAAFQKRCTKAGLMIDRKQFYPTGSPEVLQFFDGVTRIVSKSNSKRLTMDKGIDGLTSIHRLRLQIKPEGQSLNPKDNAFVVEDNTHFFIINVTNFLTTVPEKQDAFHEYDLRQSPSHILYPQTNPTTKTLVDNDEWTMITPFSETLAKEGEEKECSAQSRPVCNPSSMYYASSSAQQKAAVASPAPIRRMTDQERHQVLLQQQQLQVKVMQQQKLQNQIQHSMMKSGLQRSTIKTANPAGIGFPRAGRR